MPVQGESHMPCVMANQYNNGILFRFAGGGRKFLAMAIDMRKQSFIQGQSYAVGLKIGDRFDKIVNAQAFDPSTLTIDLKDNEDLYASLASAGTLHLDIGSDRLEFALLGVADGIKRVESCYGGPQEASAQTEAAPTSQQPAPEPMHEIDAVDPAYRRATTETGQIAPQNIKPNEPVGMRTISKPPVPADAQADGNDLANSSASETGGAKEDGSSESLIDRLLKSATESVRGAPAPASEGAPRRNRAANAPAVTRTWGNAVESSDPARGQVSSAISSVPVSSIVHVDEPAKWRAAGGSDLRSTLTQWADKENVKLEWKSDKNFALKAPLDQKGDFETAVRTALEQYDSDPLRPVGRLFRNRGSGQSVLTIDTDRSRRGTN